MEPHNCTVRIYLIRHATPDWSQTSIPYDIPPGPALTAQGEQEATQVGEFLRQQGVKKLLYSPFERAKRTAQIAAGIACIPLEEVPEFGELRIATTDMDYADAMRPAWERVVVASEKNGPVGIVSHGGPIRIILQSLGMSHVAVAMWNGRFDGKNPLPPAGVWKVEQTETGSWRLNLVFTPANEPTS